MDTNKLFEDCRALCEATSKSDYATVKAKVVNAIANAKKAGKNVCRVQLGEKQYAHADQIIKDMRKQGYKAINVSTSGMRGGKYNYIDFAWDGGKTSGLYQPK
jgi:MoaA/NifB/PqqE/SkfB family radical SAM enzyme